MQLENVNEVTAGVSHMSMALHPDNFINDGIPPPLADFSAPPPYEPDTKLPTYEEVQREKHLEGQGMSPEGVRARDRRVIVYVHV